MLAFLIQGLALAAAPKFRSSTALDGVRNHRKRYFHVSPLQPTPNILMVSGGTPTKGIAGSTGWVNSPKKARDGKLGPADMSGACFTISSHRRARIISRPSCFLVRDRSPVSARANGTRVGQQDLPATRLAALLSLTWDHRVIDGAAAALQRVPRPDLADFRRDAAVRNHHGYPTALDIRVPDISDFDGVP
jgi:pyruvate dehydrogenase E2 component (dihydrolipoamide acetyltransferase)